WALPRAWSAGTSGPVRGMAVKLKLEAKEDLEKNTGKLAGKFLLLGNVAEMKPHDKPQFQRFDDKSLSDEAQYQVPGPPRVTREEAIKRRDFNRAFIPFLAQEKPLAVIIPG